MNSHSSHCKRQFWGNPLAAQCPGVRHRVVRALRSYYEQYRFHPWAGS